MTTKEEYINSDGSLTKEGLSFLKEHFNMTKDKKELKITWTSDSHDCEDCGMDCSEGGIGEFNGKVIVDKPGFAHCFNGESYYPEDIYAFILEKLGYTITFDHVDLSEPDDDCVEGSEEDDNK